MGSAFTQVLANIYMLEWEQDLIKHQGNHKEIYGRFVKKTISYLLLFFIYLDIYTAGKNKFSSVF